MGGGQPADDHSNLTIVVPDGNRAVAHAARMGGPAPDCLPDDADMVMPTGDLWVLTELRSGAITVCRRCVDRHA